MIKITSNKNIKKSFYFKINHEERIFPLFFSNIELKELSLTCPLLE